MQGLLQLAGKHPVAELESAAAYGHPSRRLAFARSQAAAAPETSPTRFWKPSLIRPLEAHPPRRCSVPRTGCLSQTNSALVSHQHPQTQTTTHTMNSTPNHPPPTAPLRPDPNPRRALAGSRRQPARPRRVPRTDPPGRTQRTPAAAAGAPHQSRRLPHPQNAWKTSTGSSIPRSTATKSSNWPPAAICGKPRTSCFSGRRASAKPTWPRPSATKPSNRARKSSTARSSTWCATS